MVDNRMTVRFSALSQNEAFARVAAGCFASQLNPTLSELADIKTAVSEAVTNAIIHGYAQKGGEVALTVILQNGEAIIEVRDEGAGIEDVDKAREPFFTSMPSEERSGMGFTVMETFMDELSVTSELGVGTTVRMVKRIENFAHSGDRTRSGDRA